MNMLSAQKARFVQQLNILWVHEFQTAAYVRTECRGASRNKRSVSAESMVQWRLGGLDRDVGYVGYVNDHFGSFKYRIEGVRVGRLLDAWEAWEPGGRIR